MENQVTARRHQKTWYLCRTISLHQSAWDPEIISDSIIPGHTSHKALDCCYAQSWFFICSTFEHLLWWHVWTVLFKIFQNRIVEFCHVIWIYNFPRIKPCYDFTAKVVSTARSCTACVGLIRKSVLHGHDVKHFWGRPKHLIEIWVPSKNTVVNFSVMNFWGMLVWNLLILLNTSLLDWHRVLSWYQAIQSMSCQQQEYKVIE